ncbi:GntR family transcriptional regulator [[Kitasatospora] papulosa]|uniref:GntR family transcriptional regulator n=1 Tax=[Kitasatospora] papulosa TaxID=1464011 RepID=UPI0004BE2F09|nr:GntR family transcriptional regulator [[Kitasatospora] papulosa]
MTPTPPAGSAAYDANRLAEALSALIDAGDLAPGDRLPTTADLVATYGVNKNTASKAVAKLKAAGILSGTAGGRTWVRVRPQQVRRHNLRYHREKAEALRSEEERRQYGVAEADSGLAVRELHEDVYRYEIIDGPDDVRAILNVHGDARLLCRTYTRRHTAGAGASCSTSYLPHELVRANPDLLDASREPWPGGTMHQLSTVGVELDRIEDRILADMPTQDEQQLLDIPAGVPLLRIRKISFALTGEAVEVADIPLPADRSELIYTTTLERW